LAVRTGNLFLVRKVIVEFSQGHLDARYFHPEASICRLDAQFTTFFVSFPTMPISSQSDI